MIHSIKKEERLYFSGLCPRYALALCYCSNSTQKGLCRLFAARDSGTLADFLKELPYKLSGNVLSLGEFSTNLEV